MLGKLCGKRIVACRLRFSDRKLLGDLDPCKFIGFEVEMLIVPCAEIHLVFGYVSFYIH
jgi:hypothetical protein